MQLSLTNHAFAGGDRARRFAAALAADAEVASGGLSPFRQLLARAQPAGNLPAT